MKYFIVVSILSFLLGGFTTFETSSIPKGRPKITYFHVLPKTDTAFVKQTETASKVDNVFEWKVWLPTFTALLVLLLTNLVTLYKIKRDSKEAIKKEIILSKVKIEREKLEKFYDPIYTTLKSNFSIFTAYGPQSFPRDGGVLETEASEVWQRLVSNVIIPNNKKISAAIHQFSHLLSDGDSLEEYLRYCVHAESFEHFISFPNTRHKAFKYPFDFIANVEKNRDIVMNRLKSTEAKLLI